MTNEQKFNAIRERHARAQERRRQFGDDMLRKYGKVNPPRAWLTRGEEHREQKIEAAASKEHDKMFALLDDISPRNWHTGIAAWWVVEELSYADAITDGPLSTIPQPGFGSTQKDAARFAGHLS